MLTLTLSLTLTRCKENHYAARYVGSMVECEALTPTLSLTLTLAPNPNLLALTLTLIYEP